MDTVSDPMLGRLVAARLRHDATLAAFIGAWEEATDETRRDLPVWLVYDAQVRPVAIRDKATGATLVHLVTLAPGGLTTTCLDWARRADDLAAISGYTVQMDAAEVKRDAGGSLPEGPPPQAVPRQVPVPIGATPKNPWVDFSGGGGG